MAARDWRSHLTRIILLGGELSLWFLLCKTYSRGALVAALLSGVILSGVVFRLRHRGGDRVPKSSVSFDRGLTAARLLGLVILIAATGFFARVDPRFISQDASTGNRWILWKGGLQMIAVSPWSGWGEGQSGINFTQWFQPFDAHERYLGMVNSYLHVAVERGLPVLALFLFLAISLLLFAFSTARDAMSATSSPMRQRMALLVLGAGSSILSFLVANVFSTLWIFGKLWYVPAIAACIVLSGIAFLPARRWRSIGISTALSLPTACCAVLLIYLGGHLLPHDVEVTRTRSGSITLTAAGASKPGHGEKSIIVLPDSSVLGDSYGKELRRLILAAPATGLSIHVPDNARNWSPDSHSAPVSILACGDRFPEGFELVSRWPGTSLFLVHPTGKPRLPETVPSQVLVLLPSLDTTGSSRAWKKLTSLHPEWKFATSPGVGQDIRQAWPDSLFFLWKIS
ncbi:O-antigen ligase family protein [Luteolibacter ambystomatis]|uniref:O-antigen ligase family protein n=2 Tax=Luteolibacter ambystomatis TaxID=2824561 RepID=A0A975PG11_9BACT|nr:O-antigen ligase family protein [Luteolibacter ambystomatis]